MGTKLEAEEEAKSGAAAEAVEARLKVDEDVNDEDDKASDERKADEGTKAAELDEGRKADIFISDDRVTNLETRAQVSGSDAPLTDEGYDYIVSLNSASE